MPNFRRYYLPQSLVFITSVTHRRNSYLDDPVHLDLFWKVIQREQKIHQFRLLAYVILPDHFHWLMQMPEAQPDFSLSVGRIKRNFTMGIKKLHKETTPAQVWQERFWDHIIRNEDDFDHHMDYIHYNPVKHGYVKDPALWKASTFQHWVNQGYYSQDWG